MSDEPIKAGMYRGPNDVKMVSLDKRMVKVKTDDGWVDVPSVDYVQSLEQEILLLKTRLATMERSTAQHSGMFKRFSAAIKKVDSKIR